MKGRETHKEVILSKVKIEADEENLNHSVFEIYDVWLKRSRDETDSVLLLTSSNLIEMI